jgi:hypothetical protein
MLLTGYEYDKNSIEIVKVPNIIDIHKNAVKIIGKKYVSELSPKMTNGYRSFAIFPDGSKEGWDTSDELESKRDAFIRWLYQNCTDSTGCLWVDYVYFQFGDDDGVTKILSHSDEDD